MAALSQTYEHCKNPWKKHCDSEDIEVYIYYKNKQVPICKKCWGKIVEKDIEW